jgi:hypothetical protein
MPVSDPTGWSLPPKPAPQPAAVPQEEVPIEEVPEEEENE